MKEGARKSLDEQLAELSRGVEPPRNLWPGIVRGIARKPRSVLPMALAAGVASACLATALTWVVLHGRPAATPGGPAPASVAASFDEPRDSGYVAARAQLQQSFHERLALLDPATRAQIEADLAVIHRAREDLRSALAAHPESPVLEQLLESTWHDEFDLYDDVVRGTQPTLART
jgi:hypothetical protein